MDELQLSMHQKATAGHYDNRHSLADLENRAKGGSDTNALTALKMRVRLGEAGAQDVLDRVKFHLNAV